MVAPLLALGVLGVASALGYSLSRGGGRHSAARPEDGDPGRGRSLVRPDPSRSPTTATPPAIASSPSSGPSYGRGNPGGFYTSIIKDVNAIMAAQEQAKDAKESVARWAPLLAPGCARHGIPLVYALKWVDLESGGNPCDVGYPPAHGTGGPWPDAPREMGIVQFYNPDDLQALGLTADELRAYCVPGDRHPTKYKGTTVYGFSQAASRPLTAAEELRQAEAAVELIKRSMTSATHDLMSVKAGPSWSPSTRDYWAMVKLQHGLPALSRVGLPTVAKHLGRPPDGWHEFRAAIANIKLDAETERRYRKDFERVLGSAEACASVVPDGAAVV